MANSPVSHIVCTCGLVYARRTEHLPRHEHGRFACACGTSLGAWSGVIRLVYEVVMDPTAAIRRAARRIAA